MSSFPRKLVGLFVLSAPVVWVAPPTLAAQQCTCPSGPPGATGLDYVVLDVRNLIAFTDCNTYSSSDCNPSTRYPVRKGLSIFFLADYIERDAIFDGGFQTVPDCITRTWANSAPGATVPGPWTYLGTQPQGDEDNYSYTPTQAGDFDVTFALDDKPCWWPDDPDSAKIKLAVIDLNLTVDNVPDATEDTVGAFAPLNDDDDDQNGSLDLYQTEEPLETPGQGYHLWVTGDGPDLLTVQLSLGGHPNVGSVYLTATGEGDAPGAICLWKKLKSDHEVHVWDRLGGSASWDLANQPYPATLYLEGIQRSTHVRDVTLTLRYTYEGCTWSDTVKITVVDVEIDAGVPDELEENPGVRVPLNFDQDEHNMDSGATRSDLSDEELVNHGPGECLALDDLVPLTRELLPQDADLMPDVHVTLTNSNRTAVRVYTVNPGYSTAERLDEADPTDLMPVYFAQTAPRWNWHWYVEGIACGEADLTLTCSWTARSASDIVHVKVVGALVHSVTFADKQVVTRDDGNVYEFEDYLDSDDDGEAIDLYEHRFPVAYVRSTEGHASFARIEAVVFHACPATFEPGGPTNIRGVDPFGYTYSAGPGQIAVDGEEITALDLVADQPFQDCVTYLGHDDLTPYLISWSISSDNGVNWTSAGQSDNRLFILLASPTETLYETTAWISCLNSIGATTPDGVVAGSWVGMSALDWSNTPPYPPIPETHRKPFDGYNQPDGARLAYYRGGNASGTTVAALLRDTNAQCGGWAQLLQACAGAHGVPTTPVLVVADTGAHPGATGFLVNNWNFGTPPPNPPYPPYAYLVDTHVTNELGIPGQDNDDPPSDFDYHRVTRYGRQIYDPSYALGPYYWDPGDAQIIWPNRGLPNAVCIGPGSDGVLDTTPVPDDQIVGNTITTGADGVCSTYAVIGDQQILDVGTGQPNAVCIRPGDDGLLTTTPVPDDQIVDDTITTGPNGICNTTADKRAQFHENAVLAGIRTGTGLVHWALQQNPVVPELEYLPPWP